MANQKDITLQSFDATDKDIRLWALPVADLASTVIFLYEFDATAKDIRLHGFVTAEGGGGGPFPTQFAGLRTYYGAAVVELCLVAEADAPAGMGAVPKVRKGGVTYVAYLVETTDGDASSVRLRTTTGTKSVRLKT